MQVLSCARENTLKMKKSVSDQSMFKHKVSGGLKCNPDMRVIE